MFSVFLLEVVTNKGQYFNSFFNFQLNWFGKLLSTISALLIIFFLKRKKSNLEFGITFKQRKGSIKPVLKVFLIFAILEIIIVYFFFGNYNASTEEHLYQTFMPGISEEIIYRGLYLGLLNEIFERKKLIFGAYLGYGAIITIILFGLSHGISIDESFGLHFNYGSMIIPFVFAIIWTWIRERTGSVLIPIIFHNFSNEIGQIIMKLK